MDLLAEEVFRREDVEATVQVYLRMIEALKGRPYASISLKPTSLGINESEAYCQANLRRIVAAAAPHGLHITLDMEDRHFTDVTLRMFKAIRDEFDNFGIVLAKDSSLTADVTKATCAALRQALNQTDITNPLDTKRTIATGQ